ncbi:hypothetical protein Ciccas_009449 [Cichlidogyrus casuarinus]|uniref:mannose-1-phosphate guanylyltransferase n=1 Tax=Cichlidogyrus casuarinus TaxID=1844966 RepID=A0ABD2PYS1_9PLAT
MLLHQIEALAKVGVTHVILAVSKCADKSDTLETELRKHVKRVGIKISFSYENQAMGTAGPIALAKELLLSDGDNDPFFMLNSDIICEFPFADFLAFHAGHGKEASILVTQVEEPSKYGVIVYNTATGKVDRFVEKPQEYVGNKINAGLYLLNYSIIDRVPCRPTSIEKEIFPQVAADGALYCLPLKGFWMDVGQPKDYLLGTALYLNYMAKLGSEQNLRSGDNISGNVLIDSDFKILTVYSKQDPSAKVDPNCLLGPNVIVGPDVVIEEGARIRNSTLLRGCQIKCHSWIDSCIIGWDCTVGRWVRMENCSVLGEDVQVGDELHLNGAMVLPHKSISDSVKEPKIIM